MTRDDIIRMAREAGAFPELSETPEKDIVFLRRFAALVAAAEREHNMQMQNILIDASVKAEREACAKVCESLKPTTRAYDHRFWDACHESAAAIRARGQE
jgi:hypothetical protein